MNEEKKQTHDAHLNSIMKTWLLVIPMIVGIVGAGIVTVVWMTVRGGPAPTTQALSYRISSVDRDLLANIRANFDRTYLQYLQAQVNPNTRPEQVEQLEQRLGNLVQQGEGIILKYDPAYTPRHASVLAAFSGILVNLPGSVAYTLCLGVGIFLFALTRAIAFFILKRRYSLDPGSDYTREA